MSGNQITKLVGNYQLSGLAKNIVWTVSISYSPIAKMNVNFSFASQLRCTIRQQCR